MHRLVNGGDWSHGDEGVEEIGGGVTVTFDDMRHALRAVRPSAMREVAIEVPKVRPSPPVYMYLDCLC